MKYIKNITAWISDMKPGEVKSAYLPCDRVQTLNCLASRFNKVEECYETCSCTITTALIRALLH